MFLKPRAGAFDDADRSPFGNFWFGPVPGRSGGIVTGEDALRLTAVYRAVRLLADSISVLPFQLVRPKANGKGFTVIRDHWLLSLFNNAPNPYHDPATFRKLAQAHIELRGNFYARIVSSPGGEITALLPIHPDRVTIEMLDEYNWRYRVRNQQGADTFYSRTEIFHRRDLTLNGITGVNPIAAARSALNTGIAAQSYGERFFENNAQPGGWVEYEGEIKSNQDRTTFREQLQALWGGRNQGKVAVLDRGMKFHEVAVSNEDAQFIESKKFTVAEIARLFGVPPHKLGDMSASTNNNIEQQSLDFINDSLMARIVGWESSIRFELLGEQDQDLQVRFDLAALLKGDSAARRQYYQSGILSGYLTRNEARAMENLNPLDGLDEPLRPTNMVEESDAGANPPKPSVMPPALPPAGPDNDNTPPADPNNEQAFRGRNARFESIVTAAIERIARKEVQMYSKAVRAAGSDAEKADRVIEVYVRHAQFVSDALGVPIEAATDYCSQQSQSFGAPIETEDFEVITKARLLRLATE